MNIVVERENADSWWAHCPHHSDREASLIINKTGSFAGRWHCFSCGRDGWADELGFNYKFIPSVEDSNPVRDWGSLHSALPAFYGDAEYRLAKMWGVSGWSVKQFGHRWDGISHIFPMYDGQGKIIGLQRRFDTGRKICYAGSKLGLFLPNPSARPYFDRVVVIPDNNAAGEQSADRLTSVALGFIDASRRRLPARFKDLREMYQTKGALYVQEGVLTDYDPRTAYVCEGLSDAVVVHHLGFSAIGLPSATSGHEKVVEWAMGRSNGTK